MPTTTDHFSYDVYGDISDLETSFDVFKFLRKTTEALELRYFSVVVLPGDMTGSFASHSLVCNWPPDLIKLYDEADMLHTSPVLVALRGSSLPVVWQNFGDDVPAAMPDEIRGDFMARGFVRGVHFPVTDTRGLRGVVGFAGDRRPLEQGDVLELNMISIHVFNRLSNITCTVNEEASSLSERELECLKWTSAGKTSAEIAAILNLSEHTVNHYLIGATRKLEAVNRTQAVAKAVRRGWI